MRSIAICIPTLKRPDGLKKLLTSISGLTFRKNSSISVEILIVDNDPAHSAEDVVRKWQGLMEWQITYAVEEIPGIPFVRNRLIRMAKYADFIAFIDDDEIASPQWLDELLVIQAEYEADVVMGPVIPVYQKAPPHWIVKGKFHASSRFRDGLTESNLITWNVLIRRNLFDRFDLAFEERMALTGGTDILLGRMLKQVGIEFYWSDKAVVEETNPPERCRLKWLMLRRFRAGTSEVLSRKYSNERNFRIKCLLIAARVFVVGVLKIFTFIWEGKYAAVKGTGYMFQGAGLISGL